MIKPVALIDAIHAPFKSCVFLEGPTIEVPFSQSLFAAGLESSTFAVHKSS